jgi:hypothetical protein
MTITAAEYGLPAAMSAAAFLAGVIRCLRDDETTVFGSMQRSKKP